MCMAILPAKDQSKLVIDPYRQLPFQIASQPMQPVTRRTREVGDVCRRIDLTEQPTQTWEKIGWHSLR